MADRHFVGGNGTTSAGTAWNNTASWSATQGGATGASIPVAGDSIYLNKNKSAIAYLNVATTSIANGTASAPFTALYVSKGLGTNGVYVIAGTNQSTAGVAWSLTNPITIDTAQSDSTLTFRNNITGGGTITKTGPGGFGTDTIAATTWGTSPINLQEGYLFFNGANNKFGTGKITMSGGTHLFSNAANGTTYTLANPLDIRGNVDLNINSLAGRGQITFTAAVDLDSSTRTLNVGGTLTTRFTSNIVFTGVVSGTAGFNLTGGGLFGLTNTGNTVSGAVTLTGSYLLLGSTSFPPASSGNTLPSITDIAINSTSLVSIRSNAAFSIPYNITGDGQIQGLVTNASGVTIPAAKVTGFTGYVGSYSESGSSYMNIEKLHGLVFYPYGTNAKSYITYVGSTSESATLATIIYAQAGVSNPTGAFVQNGSGASTITLGTTISCTSAYTGAHTFELSGTNTNDNIVSGIISNGTASSLALIKSDVGKWILSAANTHTGATSLTGGTLVVANQNGLQNSTLTWQTAGTTLNFDAALTAATFGGLAGTAAAGLTLTIPAALTLSVGNNNSTNTFANAVSGAGTLTKIGSGAQTYSGSFAGFTGITQLSNGPVAYSGSAFGAANFNHATVGVRTTKTVAINPTVTNGYSFPAGFQLSGDGVIFISPLNVTSLTTGFTLPVGALTNLTGTAAGSAGGVVAGLASFTNNTTATNIININEFPGGGSPGVLSYEFNATTTGAMTQSIYYVSAAASHNYQTRLDIINYSGASVNTSTANLYANQSTGALVLSGGVVRYGQNINQIVNFTLRGTSTADNEISGSISQVSSILNIVKSDSGKWIISGTGDHTGLTTLSGGELVLKNSNAIQNSTFVHQTAGTTLTFDPTISSATFGGLSGTLTAGVTLTIPSSFNLSIGNNNASTTYSNILAGTNGFTKVGTGTLTLTNTGNTVDTSTSGSTVSVNAGGLALNPAGSLPNVRSFSITGIMNYVYTSDLSIAAGTTYTGTGSIWVYRTTSAALNGVTFPAGSLTGLTGDSDPTGVGVNSYSISGLTTYTSDTTNQNKANISVNDLPARLGFKVSGVTTIPNNQIKFIGTGGSYGTQIDLVMNYNNANALASTNEFYNNSTSSALILTRGIKRWGVSASGLNLTLRGTGGNPSSTDTYGEIQGVITENSLGTLNIIKNDTGKWILSGANTYTGNTTISGGELVLNNTSAVQNSTVVWQTAGTTLTIDPSLTAVTLGGLSGTSSGLTLTIPSGCTASVGNNNSSTTWANEISGSGNLTKIGTGALTLTGSLNSLSSTITLSAGGLTIDSASFGAMTINHPTVGARSTKYVNLRPTATNGYSFPAGFNLSGLGLFLANTLNITSQTTGITFPSGALSGLTGTTAGSTSGASAGLMAYSSVINATQRTINVNVNDLPSLYTFEFNFDGTGQNLSNNLYYIASGSSHTYATRFDIINAFGASAIGSNTQTASIYANQESGSLILSGGVVRYSSTSTYNVTLNLRGTSTADNEISGVISQSSGILSIQKSDAGRWKLTGANSFTGAVTVSAGTLYCSNGSAGATSSLGSSAATGAVTLAGGTLELDGCDSLRTSSAMTVSANSNVTAISGTNGLRVSGTTINNGISLTTDVADGATMLYSGTFTYGGSDSPNRFVKTGLGTLRLTSTTSTWANAGWLFTNGTVEFANIANSGGSSFGNSGSLTFRGNITVNHTGTSASTTTRSLTLGDATVACTNFVLNTNGVGGSLTFNSGSNLNIASTASPISIELGGTNSGTNSTDWLIEDSSGGGVVSLIKSGSCNWTLNTKPTYTGITICSGTGTLKFEAPPLENILLSGGLNISGGTVTTGYGIGISANIIMSGGTIDTYDLVGNKTLGIQSGASEASPATIICSNPNGSNNFSGDATINGCVDIKTPTSLVIGDPSEGTVLGSGTVTVGSSGIIRTKGGTSTLQEGRASYENLTLGNGAKLKIGFAA